MGFTRSSTMNFFFESGGFEGDAECGGVGVETGADVLDVEDEGIEIAHLLGLRCVGAEDGGGVVGGGLVGGALGGVAVETVDGELGLLVDGVADLVIGHAADAVLGAEEGDKFHVLGGEEQIDGGAAVAVAAGGPGRR